MPSVDGLNSGNTTDANRLGWSGQRSKKHHVKSAFAPQLHRILLPSNQVVFKWQDKNKTS
jgi:hypothetical protein